MAKEYRHSKGAMGSEKHAGLDGKEFYQDILHLIPPEGLLYDIGSGVGRDAVLMKDLGRGKPDVIAIDPDPDRFADAEKTYPGRFRLIESWYDANAIHRQQKIPYVVQELQNISEGFNDNSEPQTGDFVLCNAVLMFVPENAQQDFLNGLAQLTGHEKQAVVRYRTEGLKDGMRTIDYAQFEKQAAKAGFESQKTASIPDIAGRPFSWHQYILTRNKEVL